MSHYDDCREAERGRPVTAQEIEAAIAKRLSRDDTSTSNKPAIEQQVGGDVRGIGMKYDGGKPRWSLLMQGMSKALEGVAEVLTFGARKYAAHSWRTVPEGADRYRDALYRHLAAFERGELTDPESGLPHLDHALCNLLFVRELSE